MSSPSEPARAAGADTGRRDWTDLRRWVDGALAQGGHGRRIGDLAPLPAEASRRRFFRVRTALGTFVAMHSPPEFEDNERFVRFAKLLRAHQLGAPAIHATHSARGYMLLEDLGSRDFQDAYAGGAAAPALDAAIADLVTLQGLPAWAFAPYTAQRFREELGIFEEWLVGRWLGLRPPPCFAAAAEALVAATQDVPQRPLHRDYHCRNLLWREDGTVGIVDFQDALVGPVTYDIASLLRDCYHEFDEAEVARWRRRFFAKAGFGGDERAFVRAFELTALQRQLKAVGIFARLWLRDQRRSHLGDIAPVLGRIARLGRTLPETAALARWIDATVLPAARRRLAAPCGAGSRLVANSVRDARLER